MNLEGSWDIRRDGSARIQVIGRRMLAAQVFAAAGPLCSAVAVSDAAFAYLKRSRTIPR
jgi:hypothetical protein